MDPTLPVSTQPTSPLSSITPVDPEKPVSKIWLWIVGGILLLGVGIVGGVFLGKQLYSKPLLSETFVQEIQPSPTPTNPTANWKTYTDPYNQFSFKYPAGYSLDTTAVLTLNRNISWRYTPLTQVCNFCEGIT